MSASMAARWSAGSDSTAASTLAQPLFGSPPAAAIASPCLAKTSAKKTSTAWPNMIGSETFIIVALRWIENSTPWSLASAHLLGEERTQRGHLHHGRVDDLAGEDRDRLLEHRHGAVGADVLDAQRASRRPA